MTHDPLCPKWFDTYNDQIECPTCDLIDRAYQAGWDAGYKQCDDEWSGKARYN